MRLRSGSVEGSLAEDDSEAARMIRKYARDNNHVGVARE
jgi:hypothetical protein